MEDLSHLGASAVVDEAPVAATDDVEVTENKTDDEKLVDAGLGNVTVEEIPAHVQTVATDIITDDMKNDLAGRETPTTDEEKAGAA